MDRTLTSPLSSRPSRGSAPAALRNPARVVNFTVLSVIWAWVAVAGLHEMPIGGIWDDVALSTWVVIVAWLGAFTLTAFATVAFNPLPTKHEPPPITDKWLNLWISALCALSVAGAVLIVFEFAVIREYGFAAAAAAIRAEEANTMMQSTAQGSVISGVGRLLLPAFMVCAVLVTRYWARLSRLSRTIFVVSGMVVIYEQLFFEGGRFFLTMTCTSALSAYLLMPKRVLAKEVAKRRFKFLFRISVGSVVMLWFFTYVFVERVIQRDGYLWSAYLTFASNFDLTPNYRFAGLSEGAMGPLWFSATMIWIYVTQGINEFDLLLSTRYFEHAWGLYQVPHVGQALNILFGIDIRYDVVRNLPTLGSYATFLGHNYVDFGVGGTIASGALLSWLMVRSVQSFAADTGEMLAYLAPFAVTLAIFSPIVSLVPNLWPAMVWAIIVGWSVRGRFF